jgi:hypothetical protein
MFVVLANSSGNSLRAYSIIMIEESGWLLRKELAACSSNSSYNRLLSICPKQLIIKVKKMNCIKNSFFVMIIEFI